MRPKFMPLLVIALALLLGQQVACKKEDPLDEAVALIDSDPKAAAAKLEELHKQKPDDYDALFYLATAYHEAGDWEKAIDAFEQALTKPESKNTTDLIKDRLYTALMKAVDESKGDDEKRLVLLTKAAKIEEDLSKRNIKANKELYNLKKAAFEKAAGEERFEDAIALAESVRALYYGKEFKRALLKQIPGLRKALFYKKTRDAFASQIKPDLVKAGEYEEASDRLIFAREFEVPAKTEEGEWDEAAANFEEVAKHNTCVPLAAELGRSINRISMASPYGQDLADQYMNYYANEASKTLASGWKEPHAADAVRAEGETWTYTCKMHLPMSTIVDNLYLVYREAQKKGGKADEGDAGEEGGKGEQAAEPAPEAPAPAEKPKADEEGAAQPDAPPAPAVPEGGGAK